MTTIANLSVKIASDITALTSGLTQADNQIANFGRNVGNRFTALRTGMDNFVAGMAPISAMLGVGLGLGVRAASDFESILTEIEVRTQSTADEMARLEDFALQMGAETAFSSQDAAEGMLKLLTSGQDVETAMATLPAVLDAAAASGESLGVAADGVTSIMAAFQVGAEGAAGVSESLARASGASKAEMSDLILAFQNGGSSADAYGLSVNRTAAILGIFGNRGKVGAEAGTLLKSMLENMSRNTDAVKGAWDDLNTSMYDSQGNMRDFTLIIDDIKAGLEGMTTEEQNRVLQDLAGTYGIAGLRALITGDSIQDMEAAMLSATSATDLADAKMGTFAGKFDTLKGSVETAIVQALTPFMDNVLTPMIDDLTPIVNSIGEWVSKNPQLTSTILAVAGGLAVATPMVWAMSTALGAVTALAGPVGLVFLGVVGLVGAVSLWNTSLTDTLTVGEAVGAGMATIIEDMSRRFRILFLDIEWWTQSAIGAIKSATGDEAGAMAARLRIDEINIEKGNFKIGDALYTALIDGSDDFRAGLPFSLPDDLALQIQNDPASLVDNLSLPTKALMIEAWNAAVAAGDMDFISDAMPLIAAIDESGFVPTWGGDINLEGVRSTLLTELQTAIDNNDGTEVAWNAIIDLQQMALRSGVEPSVVQAMFANVELEDTLNTGLQTAIDTAAVTGWLDLSKIEISTGASVLDPETGIWTPQVLTLDDMLTIDVNANPLAQKIINSGPEVGESVLGALRTVLLIGDGNQQQAVFNLAEMIGIDTDAFAADFRKRASELDLGGDITRTLTESINTGDLETAQFLIPILPFLDYDRTTVMAAISTAVTENKPEQVEVATALNFGVLAADEAKLSADTALVITTATEGLDVPIDTAISPQVSVPGSFRSNVAGILAGQLEGMTIQANVHVTAAVTGTTPVTPPPDGSHRSGLDRVPRDRYMAELHADEAVLTAEQASEWRDGRGGQRIEKKYYVSSYGQSPHELLELIRRADRDGSR